MDTPARKGLPETWGGLECTINRVNNSYVDQLALGGFYDNPGYLDAVLELNITTLRFPILWEKHESVQGERIDWAWATSALNKIRAKGINPVVGLVHHGSGPSFTNLLDEDFPYLLAKYAGKVASEFPWITDYTPVNEPLTTARFAGLYGLWYPHKDNDVSFIKMLLNQLKGVVLSMQEVRKINPAARLIQTEDLGKTYSTELLAYQAKFENLRRWLTFDILCGKFNPKHPLWNYFMRLGISPDAMKFFLDYPCIPDMVGVNHYVTSERFLDHQLENYEPHNYGGNGIHQYADVEAVRVKLEESHGAEILLREIYKRYKLPVAITEAHMHCSREEQVRWFKYMFETATRLRSNGVDIIAVTAWALLGSFGWNKLLTSQPYEYETGAFDTSAGYARPAAMAAILSNNTNRHLPADALFALHGWWQRPSRFFNNSSSNNMQAQRSRPLIIFGKNGKLGEQLARECAMRNIPFKAFIKSEADICNTAALERIILDYNPWAIINAAGYVNVDAAETNIVECSRLNTLGPQKLAILCERFNIKLLCFSSDLVFDGQKNTPYVESDEANPLNVYGSSKLQAETFLKNVNPLSLIIRTSAFFSIEGKPDFLTHVLQQLNNGSAVEAIDDLIVSPTYVPHLVEACLNLLIDDAKGVWHLANKGAASWYDFAASAAGLAGLNSALVKPVAGLSVVEAARPAYSVLGSEKYGYMPSLETALNEYFKKQKVTV